MICKIDIRTSSEQETQVRHRASCRQRAAPKLMLRFHDESVTMKPVFASLDTAQRSGGLTAPSLPRPHRPAESGHMDKCPGRLRSAYVARGGSAVMLSHAILFLMKRCWAGPREARRRWSGGGAYLPLTFLKSLTSRESHSHFLHLIKLHIFWGDCQTFLRANFVKKSFKSS